MKRKVTIADLIRREGREPGGKRKKRTVRSIPAEIVIERLIGKSVTLRFVGKALFDKEKA